MSGLWHDHHGEGSYQEDPAWRAFVLQSADADRLSVAD